MGNWGREEWPCISELLMCSVGGCIAKSKLSRARKAPLMLLSTLEGCTGQKKLVFSQTIARDLVL